MSSLNTRSGNFGNIVNLGNIDDLGSAGKTKRKIVWFPIFWLILTILLLGSWSPTVLGQIITIDEARSFANYTQAEIDAVRRAVTYWNEVINTPLTNSNEEIGAPPIYWVENSDLNNVEFDSQISPKTIYFDKENNLGDGAAHANSTHVSINNGTTWNTGQNTQIKNGTRNLESIIVHELAHSLGINITGRYVAGPGSDIDWEIDVNNNGTSVKIGTIQTGSWSDFLYAPDGRKLSDLYGQTLAINPSNPYTFRGANAMDVWGDGTAVPVPVESRNFGPGSTLVHPSTSYGNMNCQYDANTRPFFSEVELAIMQDLGYDIDIRNFFGRSLYQTHTGTITNDAGFNGTGTYGIGLHMVAGGNTVVQNADLHSAGYAGAGIRIENNNNRVTVNNGVTVSATGAEGVGVLITHSTGTQTVNNTILTNHGTIEAAGLNGIGVWFNARGTLNNYGYVDSTRFDADAVVNNFTNADIGKVNINRTGVTVNNGGYIGELISTVNGTYNSRFDGQIGTIGLFNVDRNVSATDWGHIVTANINSGGRLTNMLGNTITLATMSGGVLENRSQIDKLTYISGTYNRVGTGNISTLNLQANAGNTTWGSLGMVNVYSGANFTNGMNGNVAANATVNSGGVLDNRGAITNTAVVNDGGTFTNYSSSTVGVIEMFGGNVANAGNVDSLTYYDGIYTGQYAGNSGSIGSLTVAGDSTGRLWGSSSDTSHWGNIGSLQFASSGDGYISVAAFADSDWSSISFAGINAQSVDLNYGNIVIDVSSFGLSGDFGTWGYTSLSFALADLFGGADIVADITGTLNSLHFVWGEDLGFWLCVLDDGEFFGAGWDIDYATGLVTWDGTPFPWAIPEPATILILGLGLTGLGLARRRMKR